MFTKSNFRQLGLGGRGGGGDGHVRNTRRGGDDDNDGGGPFPVEIYHVPPKTQPPVGVVRERGYWGWGLNPRAGSTRRKRFHRRGGRVNARRLSSEHTPLRHYANHPVKSQFSMSSSRTFITFPRGKESSVFTLVLHPTIPVPLVGSFRGWPRYHIYGDGANRRSSLGLCTSGYQKRCVLYPLGTV